MAAPEGYSDKVAFVWKVVDKPRGLVKPHDNCSVMLRGGTRNSGSTLVRDLQARVTFPAANLRNERGEIKQAQSQSDHADEGCAGANEDVAELWRHARRLPAGRQHLPSPKARSACRP